MLSIESQSADTQQPSRFGIDGGNLQDSSTRCRRIFFNPCCRYHFHPFHVLSFDGLQIVQQLLPPQTKFASVQIDFRDTISISFQTLHGDTGTGCHAQNGAHVLILIKRILGNFGDIAIGMIGDRPCRHHHFVHQLGILTQCYNRKTDILLHLHARHVGDITDKRDFQLVGSFRYRDGESTVGIRRCTTHLATLLDIRQLDIGSRQGFTVQSFHFSAYPIYLLRHGVRHAEPCAY